MEKKNERRAEKRVPLKLEVRFKSAAEAVRVFQTYSLNVSPSGICIRSTHQLSQGESIGLSLWLGGQKFELSGRVAWVQEDVVGVRFEGVSPAEKLRLESAIWLFSEPHSS